MRFLLFSRTPPQGTTARHFSNTATIHHNLTAFGQPVAHWLQPENLPDLSSAFKELQNHGATIDNGKIAAILTRFNQTKHALLNNNSIELTPIQLLLRSQRKIPLAYQTNINLYPILPAHFKMITPLLKSYSECLYDISHNSLSTRDYEQSNVTEQENVSEAMHGHQAAAIALELNMSADSILAMLFHDIARCTVPEHEYAHRNHHSESHEILKPLFLFPYSLHHPAAKWLWSFSKKYNAKLISPLSESSLKLQSHSPAIQFEKFIDHINTVSCVEASDFILKLLLMRLIDDLAKVPPTEINGRTLLFSKNDIQSLIAYQAIQALYCKNPLNADNFERGIYQAYHDCRLYIERGEKYTQDRELYKNFRSSAELITLFLRPQPYQQPNNPSDSTCFPR